MECQISRPILLRQFIKKYDHLLVSVEKRPAPEEVIHGLRHVLVHPDIQGMKILPAQLKQLLVEVDQGPHDVDRLRPLGRLEVVVRGHGARLPGLHAVQDVGGEQGGEVVGVHLVARQLLPVRTQPVLAVLGNEVEEVQEDVHRVSVDLEM